MLKQFLTISMMLLGAFAWGQGFTVSGRVEDGKSHEAVPFTNVALLRTADSVFMRGGTTDDKGVYTIRDVSAGDYLLKVAFAGYEPYWQAVSISGDTELPLISLTTSAVMLEGVVVTAERPLFSMDGEKMLYNTAEDPTVQTGTAADALRSMPDVQVDGEGNITLRGVSGVEVWLNGKPSHLEGEALKQYIKTLPASAIERLEVITNPSARYSTANGVINIVTNQKVVLNDFLSVKLEGNSQPMARPWVTYVHTNDRMMLNLFGSPNFMNNPMSQQGGYTMRNVDSLVTETQHYDYQREDKTLGYFFGGTMSYQLDTANNVAAWIGLFGNDNRMSSSNDVVRNRFLPLADSLYFTEKSATRNRHSGGYGGVQYTHDFDNMGHQLLLSASANLFGGTVDDELTRLYHTPGTDYQYISNQTWKQRYVAVEADYTKPFGEKTTLEAGLMYDFLSNPGNIVWQNFDTLTQGYLFDSVRSYDKRVHNAQEVDAYATLTRRFGNLTAKAGLRAEEIFLYRTVNDDTQWTVDENFFNLVPSLHLTYRTEKNDNFSLSYTRRYSSPDANMLCAYRYRKFETFETGNPALRCAYTHNLEAAWSRFLPKFGSVSLNAYYRANTDEIQMLTDCLDDPFFGRYVQCLYPVNVGNSHTLGGTANVTYRPNAMLNFRLNASLFDNYYRAQLRPNEWAESEMLSYSLSFAAWAKVWKVVDVFCNAFYSSPTQSLLATRGDTKRIDLGMSADLLDHKLTIFLGVNDIFNWNARESENLNPYYTSWSTAHERSQYVYASLTWRLGKLELERMAKQGQ